MANKYEVIFNLTTNQGNAFKTAVRYHFACMRLVKNLTKSNNVAITDKDRERWEKHRPLQLIWKSIQSGYSSVFIPHFIKAKTPLIVRCIIILCINKRRTLWNNCKTSWISEMLKWEKRSILDHVKYNSEKIVNKLNVYASQNGSTKCTL